MLKRTVIASCALVLMATLAADADAKLRNPFKKDEESSESQGEAKSQGGTQKVKGVNGKEGEIVGTPAANSPFNKLQIGMPVKQVMDLLGNVTATDTGHFRTGKGYIPYYHGGDTWRDEYVYKGIGRLTFTGSSENTNAKYLLKIEHNSNEEGYYK